MTDRKELKPKSFRIDEETANKFKEISDKIGGNQQETLAKLIEAFEFQSGKAILTEKKDDIEQFERHVNALTRMFMGSLEDSQNMRETIRTEFDALLKSKDATIQDLQENLNAAKRLKEEALVKAKTYEDENAHLKEAIGKLNNEYDAKLEDMKSSLLDKDNLNKTLMDSCNDLKAKMDDMKEQAQQAETLRKELEQLKKEHEKAVREKETYKKNISELKEHEADALERLKEQLQIEQEKKALETEKSHHEQLQRLKDDRQAEIDKYQQNYFELLKQMKSQTAAVGQD